MRPAFLPLEAHCRHAAKRAERGSVLIIALFCITFLAILLSSTLLTSQNEYHVVFQAASWQEALHGAEAGVDLAVAALNTNQWQSWQTASGTPPRTAPANTANAKTAAGPPAAGSYNFQTLTLSHGGEGNQQVAVFVTVDAPASLTSAPNGQWMRIRAVGTTTLPGSREVSLVPEDTALRRLSFFTNRDTGAALTTPQTSRFVEAVTRLNGATHAIVLQRQMVMSGGTVVDSFDSTDSTKSTNSLYDVKKRQSHGDVAMANSVGADLGNCNVYGNVYYNTTPPKNTSQVHGTLSGGYTSQFAAVSAPNPTTWIPTSTTTSITSTTTLTAGTKANPARYKLSQLALDNADLLTINAPAGGGDSYIEFWVTGNLTTGGSGTVTQMPGVHSTYYVQGAINLSGGSFVNKSNVATNLQINGVDPAGGGTHTMTIAGSGSFVGVINAPNFDFNISGAGEYSGSLIGHSINLSGGANFHYDEALNKASTTFSVASWYEDLH